MKRGRGFGPRRSARSFTATSCRSEARRWDLPVTRKETERKGSGVGSVSGRPWAGPSGAARARARQKRSGKEKQNAIFWDCATRGER